MRKSYSPAHFFLLALTLGVAASCTWDQSRVDWGDQIVMPEIPPGFSMPPIPDDNRLTPYRIELGRRLFFDPILSRDSTISCGSCHHADKKMTDGLSKSIGIDGQVGIRNAISLLNVAYQPYLFWDGGVPTLETQVLAPIHDPKEMDFDINLVVERLKRHPEYPALFYQAYKAGPSPYTVTRAIACFERSLYSSTTRYDRYVLFGDTTALTASEKRGMELFFSERAECFHCHSGFLFTDFSFRNNGLYEKYADSGRARITLNPDDVGKFKVPSLRNLAYTAPYMHDGSLATLRDVIEHYNSGGKNHPNKSIFVRQLALSEQEKEDLINFLLSLSDP
ncbi:MAG: cytochrome-c peroxidase [Chitinophagales bacterium]|nr:cytochrome-c peroxidase [Chitinophagales bacterium]MDW8428719.1 cytochrome c peroxidase [Chitinophagales bacterium]